jgi:hypothetical protein
VRRFPQVPFQQLRGFDAEGDGEVFGVVELPPVPFIAKSQQPFRQHGDLGFLWGLIRGIHVVSEKIRWQSGGYKELLGCRSLCPLTRDERSPSLAGALVPG